MLRQLKIDGIKLPKLYVATNAADAKLAESNGLPYVRWKGSDESLIKLVFIPTLKRLFPYIRWDDIFPSKKYKTLVVHVPGGTVELDDEPTTSIDNGVSDIATSERGFLGANNNEVKTMSLEEYAGDMTAQVDLDVLQELELMPQFIGDIIDCIKRNLTSFKWTEGYNKKRGVPIGNFSGSKGLKNLIILDVSASIPRGISATMLSLIDTLRTKIDADLIVTAARSYYFEMGTELPSPDELREMCPPGNESHMFHEILAEHIVGREWGNVICFGDYDHPCTAECIRYETVNLANTVVHELWNYHTYDRGICGYGRWAAEFTSNPVQHYNTDWVRWIKE